jgi:hypothetical protein
MVRLKKETAERVQPTESFVIIRIKNAVDEPLPVVSLDAGTA